MQETEKISGTRVATLIEELDGIYAEIERTQRAWREATPFGCPDGCGSCCVDFEPDVLECEALYLASWMLFHQRERALAILSGSFVSPRPDPERGCFLFDHDSPWHCTVYGGRCLICRLFGYSGDRGKDGLPRWKPCKHLPGDAHKQYGSDELVARFGAAPPSMGDCAAQVSGLMPDGSGDRKPLREALPLAIANLVLLERLSADGVEQEKTSL